MPESLLTILKFLFLALVWLFFARVLRAVQTELKPVAAAGSASAAASPTRGAVAHLKVVEPADKRGQVFDLGDELTVGRAGGCQIALEDDKTVSQLHARVFRRDGRVYVEDLGSTNGTYLNQRKVTVPTEIGPGDKIRVGKTTVEVRR